MNTDAILLLSGGQDSTVCLAWSLQQFDEVVTVGFDYGQSHAVELECRADVLVVLNPGGEDHLINLSVLNDLSPTSLTRADIEIKALEGELCQRRSKNTPLAGVKVHHRGGVACRFDVFLSPMLRVVPVVHGRAPRCFV